MVARANRALSAHGVLTVLCGCVLLSVTPGTLQGAGKLRFAVTGEDGKPVPCRIHLKDDTGKPIRAGALPFWRDHFVCPGIVELDLPAGRYRYEIERGPEHQPQSGAVTLTDSGEIRIPVRLKRIANLQADGWWSGDLHVHRPVEQIELLMQAEDLHVAPVITWWNKRNLWTGRELPETPLKRFDKNRFYHVLAGEDEREGGALMFFHLNKPLMIADATREYPSPMKFVEQARKNKRVWIDVEKPFWWDVPVWLSSGQIDSIGLANNHMCRSRMYETEAWGKPRDGHRLPAPRGNGYWTQEIYYHILNCGLRIPPSAGSASGVLPNPVGYNRVYVHTGKKLDHEQWWQNLKAGRSFVTNGPLLLCTANGEMPGHIFKAIAGRRIDIQLSVSITSREPLPPLEIIKNGRVEQTVALEKQDDLGVLTFRKSGWFLVRAIADNPRTFRFASTAPFYVEVGPSKNRVSKQSAQFFVDWVNERIARIKLTDATQRREVLGYQERARSFWQNVLASANAE